MKYQTFCFFFYRIQASDIKYARYIVSSKQSLASVMSEYNIKMNLKQIIMMRTEFFWLKIMSSVGLLFHERLEISYVERFLLSSKEFCCMDLVDKLRFNTQMNNFKNSFPTSQKILHLQLHRSNTVGFWGNNWCLRINRNKCTHTVENFRSSKVVHAVNKHFKRR